MKNNYFFIKYGFILLPLFSVNAFALDLKYAHEYEDLSNEHTDKIQLSHTFENGIGVAVKWKLQPKETADGSAGQAFSNDQLYEHVYKLNYHYDLNDHLELIPTVSWTTKTGGTTKFKPNITLNYSLPQDTKLSLKYRYEEVDYRDSGSKYGSLVEGGISHKFDRVKVAYKFGYYTSNVNLYDQQKHDYIHKLTVGYKLTKKFAPYVELKNESYSSKSDRRTTSFTLGFNYKFL